MNNLTIIIISRNDSDVIGDAIASSKKLTKNIIVIDSNNDDKTINICQKHGVRVVKNVFKNFSDQRNFGISHATTDWVLYIDSDERLTDSFCYEVSKVIKNYDFNSPIVAFRIRRKTFYYGKDWNFVDSVERLFFRKKFIRWEGIVHETPKVDGEISEIHSSILHYTHRNLSQMVAKTNEWSNYEAYLRFRNNHPILAPWRFFRVMATEFFNSYIKNKGFKNGTYGLIEAMYQAFSVFITYAKLWELQEKKS
jgi:glycosyltransferase involved in cell wall biosynthesis